jgi:hypothetical protein
VDETRAGWRPLARLDGEPSAFSRLAVTHALAAAGDALVTMALAGSLFFSISPHAARGRVALSLVLTIAPFAVVAPFLGPAIDRRESGRRTIVFVAAAGRALTCLYMARVIHGLMLFPAAFVSLVLSKTHAVAKSSLVPTVVTSDDELVEANSKLALIAVIMGFVAAIPGVPVLKLLGGEWVLRLAALVFAAGAFSALRLQPTTPAPPAAPTASTDPPDVLPTRAVTSTITAAAIAMGGLRASVGFLTFLAAFSLRRGHAPAWVFGAVLAASLGGTLVGAAAAPRLRKAVVEERLVTGSLALVAVAGLIATRLHPRPAAVVLAAAVGLAAGVAKLAFDAIVQRDAPDGARGRQFARFEAAFQLAWVVGSLAPVAIPMPIRMGAFVLGVGGAALAGSYLALRGRP